MAAIDEKLLEERLTALESARTWSPRLVSKLESHIRSAERRRACCASIRQIRQPTRASHEAETIDLFLHASALGLFEMNWILLCPVCSCVIDSFRALRNLNSHCRCTNCRVDLVAALDDMIAVTFTVNPAVRRIAYHDPETLSVEDYILPTIGWRRGADPGRHALHQDEGDADPGDWPTSNRARRSRWTWWRSRGDARQQLRWRRQVPVHRRSGASAAEQRIAIRCDIDSCTPDGGTFAPGKVTFELTSIAKKRFAFAVMQFPPNVDRPPPLHFAPFLSGKRLLTTQTFRDLFRSEVIRGSEGIGVKDIALLFTDLKGSTALYDRIGDLNAFALVQQHFERLQDVTVRHNGAIIKTIGDAIMAAFLNPADAVQAALDMRSEIASFNERQPDKALILKIGVHKGAAIAVTLNERLDYFGQTVNIAARVQNLADADEIFVSQDVYDAAGVRDELAAFPVEAQMAQLRGVQQELPVFRVGRALAAAAA